MRYVRWGQSARGLHAQVRISFLLDCLPASLRLGASPAWIPLMRHFRLM